MKKKCIVLLSICLLILGLLSGCSAGTTSTNQETALSSEEDTTTELAYESPTIIKEFDVNIDAIDCVHFCEYSNDSVLVIPYFFNSDSLLAYTICMDIVPSLYDGKINVHGFFWDMEDITLTIENGTVDILAQPKSWQNFSTSDISTAKEKYKSQIAPFFGETDLHNSFSTLESVENKVEEKTQKKEDKSYPIYSDEYVSIEFSHGEINESEFFGTESKMFFLAENKTDHDIIFSIKSISVNGWSLTNAFCFDTIAPYSKGYVEVRADDKLPSSISKMTGSFSIIDKSNEVWGSLEYKAEFFVGDKK